MKQGMLWYDDRRNADVKERITSAVRFFESKYGYLPKKCFVNPIMLDEPMDLDQNIKVFPRERVIANHFWLEFSSE